MLALTWRKYDNLSIQLGKLLQQLQPLPPEQHCGTAATPYVSAV